MSQIFRLSARVGNADLTLCNAFCQIRSATSLQPAPVHPSRPDQDGRTDDMCGRAGCGREGAASKARRARAGGVSPATKWRHFSPTLTVNEAEHLQGGLATRRFGSIRRGYLPGRFCDAASMPRRPCMHGPCADCRALESCTQAVVCLTISSTERSGTLLEAALERIQARGS